MTPEQTHFNFEDELVQCDVHQPKPKPQPIEPNTENSH